MRNTVLTFIALLTTFPVFAQTKDTAGLKDYYRDYFPVGVAIAL